MVGDGLFGEPSLCDVESPSQHRVVLTGLLPAFLREREDMVDGGVGQALGRSTGLCAGHVGHGIMDHAVLGVDRV